MQIHLPLLLPSVILSFLISAVTTAGYSQEHKLGWARSMMGTQEGVGYGIATDASGNVYTTGFFSGMVDADPGPNMHQLNSVGGNDIFVQKLDESGNLIWAQRIGGPGNDVGNALAIDGSGNVYIAGSFSGMMDIDSGFGIVTLTSSGDTDAFVLKLNGDGDFIWATHFGGSGSTVGNALVVDVSGNVYIAGAFSGTMDVGSAPDVFQLNSAGDNDIFVQKLDEDGNFVWTKHMGGPSSDVGNALAVDASGNVYVAGSFSGTVDFDAGSSGFPLTSLGYTDVFVQHLDEDGNFVWVRRIGGSGYDVGNALAVDASGNVYTTGSFNGTVDFDPGAGSSLLTSSGSTDAFVQKLDGEGNFVWAKGMGGSGIDAGYAIAVDAKGNVFTAGNFFIEMDVDPGPGTYPLSAAGSADIFVQQLDSDGKFVWGKRMGGNQYDIARAIAVDATANVFTTGNFTGAADFDPGSGAYPLTATGIRDVFVHKLLALEPITPDANNVVYVDIAKQNVPGHKPSGESWQNAVPELADVLRWARRRADFTADDPLKIYIAKGTYKPLYDASDGRYAEGGGSLNSFVMIKNVQLYGGFDPANDIIELSHHRILPDHATDESEGTILSGDLDNSGDHSNGDAVHVVLTVNDVGTASLDGLTITGGFANANGGIRITVNNVSTIYLSSGAGIYNHGSSLRLTDVHITGNKAAVTSGSMAEGGGMYNSSAAPVLTNVVISNNEVYNATPYFDARGGGMSNSSSSPVLTNVLIYGNTARSVATLAQGGGIYNGNSSPLLTNVTVVDNHVAATNPASATGGGIYYDISSSLRIDNSIIWNNQVNGDATLTGADVQKSGSGTLVLQNSITQGYAAGANNVVQRDPVFVDPTRGNYTLAATSPAVNAGDNARYTAAGGDLPNGTDLAGSPRLQKGIIDLGVYESPYEALPGPDANNVLYVDRNVAGGNGSGNSWTNAFSELTDALKWATDHAGEWSVPLKIWVAKGVYTPAKPVDPAAITNAERHAAFRLVMGVELYGGFDPANGITERAHARLVPDGSGDIRTDGTILSGDIDANDDNVDGIVTDPSTQLHGSNSYTVVDGSATDATAVLDGFIITAGNADGNTSWPSQVGGGIYNDNGSSRLNHLLIIGNRASMEGGGMFNHRTSSPVLREVTIRNNQALYSGGGMLNDGGSSPDLSNVTIRDNRSELGGGGGMSNTNGSNPKLEQVTVSSNRAGQVGGGISNALDSSPELEHVTISGNSAGSDGGGMYSMRDSSPKLQHVKIFGNTAALSGGGMLNYLNAPVLTNVTISGNTAGGDGGGMGNINSSPALTNVAVSENTSSGSGGGIYNRESSLMLTHVKISKNTSSGSGGGMCNSSGSAAVLANVVISGNTANQGGGMYNTTSSSLMNNVVISGNTANALGGGMYNNNSNSVVLANAIVWNNRTSGGTTSSFASIYNSSSKPIISFSLIANSGGSGSTWVSGTGEDGGNNLDADPLFTEAVDFTAVPLNSGDFSLQAGSPAINAGDPQTNEPDYPVQAGAVDMADAIRIFDGRIDMGVYERLIKQQAFYIGGLEVEELRVTYGDADFVPAVTASSGGVVTFSLKEDNEVARMVDGKIRVGQAGEAVLIFDVSGDAEYDPASVSIPLVVEKKVLTVVLDADPVITKVYDGTATATLTADNYSLGGVVGDEEVTVTGTASYDDAGAREDKEITVTDFELAGTTKDNYRLSTTAATTTGTITVRPLTLTAERVSKVYGTATDPALSVVIGAGSLAAGDAISEVTGMLRREPGELVGVYGIMLGSGLKVSNYRITFIEENNAFTITPRTLAVRADAGQGKVYSSDDPALTFTAVGFASTDDKSILTGSLSRAPGEDADSYAIGQGTLDAGNNYTIAYTGADFAVTPKTLVVTADAGQGKVYGSDDPALTFTAVGFAFTDDKGILTGALSRAPGEDADSYVIGQGTVDAGNNYTIAYTGADFTVTPKTLAVTADAGQGKVYGSDDPALTFTAAGFGWNDDESILTGALSRAPGEDVDSYAIGQGTVDAGNNYVIVYTGADFTVTPKTLAVTADAGQSKVYGTADPTLTFTALGFASTDDKGILTGSLSRSPGEDADSYAIGQGTVDAGDNYAVAYTGADFTVTPKTLAVTADAGQSKVYGTADPTLTFTASGFALTDDKGILTGVLSRVPGEDVDDYAIGKGTLDAGNNYTIAYTGADFTVMPKTLTVTADAGQSKVYGTADPTLRFTAVGFALTDDKGILTGALSRAPGEDVDSYAIGKGTLDAGNNYAVAYTGADFTVTPKTLAVTADAGQSKVYGTADPTLTFTASGFALTDDKGILAGSLSRAPGEEVNDYAIGKGTLDAGSNYTVAYTGADFTVTPKTLVVTADAGQGKVYGSDDPALTFTAVGFVWNDDESILTGTLSRAPGEEVDDYAIGKGTLDAGSNYTVAYTGADFTVTPKTLAVTADAGQNKEYGTTDPVLTFTASGFAFTDDKGILTGALSRTPGEDVYVYTIRRGTLDAGANYTISYTETEFTIIPKSLTVALTATPAIMKVYDGTAVAQLAVDSYTLTGIAGGDEVMVSGVATYEDPRAGKDKKVTVTDFVLGGSDAGRYRLSTAALFTTGAIMPKPLAVSLNAIPAISKVYDGTDAATLAAGNYSLVGIVERDEVTVSGSATYEDSQAGPAKKITATGFILGGADSDNYRVVAASSTTAGVILAKKLVIRANHDIKEYSGQPYSNGNGVVYEGFVPGEDASVLSGALSYGGTSQGATDTGEYAIEPSGYGSSNYTLTYVDGVLTISGRAENRLFFYRQQTGGTVTRTYGDGNVDGSAMASSGLAVSYTSSDETVATIDSDGQVRIVGVGETAITASQGGNVNHNPAADISFTLAVGPKALAVTARNATKGYDNIPYSSGNGVDYKGFITGEDESALSGTVVYAGSSQGAVHTGSYVITPAGLTSDNYAITYVNGRLDIVPAGANVLSFDSQISGSTVEVVYGAMPLSAAARATSHLSVSYSSSDEDVATVDADGTVTIRGAGSARITASQPGDVNHDAAAGIGFELRVARKVLTVTAGNASRVYDGLAYGGGNGVVYEGFVPEEGISVLGGALTYGGTSQGAIHVGSYVIVPSGLEAANYALEYRNGSLSITPAARSIHFPVLPAKTYGDADFDAGADASSSEDISYTSSNPSVAEITAGGRIRIRGAGETTIAATVPENGNYGNRPEVSRVLRVRKAAQAIEFDAPARVTRDAGSVRLDVSADSGLPVALTVDDPEVATVSGTALNVLRLGTVRITATQAGDGSHEAADPLTVTVQIVDPTSDFPIRVHHAVSPNGDGINEYLVIEAVKDYPENRVRIFNRNGTVVYEASGYNNGAVAFRGIGTGQHRVPAGTYFYVVDIRIEGEWKHEKGWFMLRY